MLAPVMAAQTAFQVMAGVTFTTAEIVGPIGSFALLSGGALGFLVALLRGMRPAPLSNAERAIPPAAA